MTELWVTPARPVVMSRFFVIVERRTILRCYGKGSEIGFRSLLGRLYCGAVTTQMIILNGGSSSGKTGIGRCLQAVLPDHGWSSELTR